MENELNEIPVKISHEEYELYGMLRMPEQCEKLAIFVPWILGDRTGMGRLYVEVARALYDAQIASFCVDLPPNNYCMDHNSASAAETFHKLAFFIEKYVGFIKENYPKLEIVMIGYCSSSIASIYAARKEKINKVIAINPWDYMFADWVKPPHDIFYDYFKFKSHTIKIHYIFAEYEEAIQRKINYLKKYFEDENCSTITEVIPKADHLFCNWDIKKKVIEILKDEISS
jgi:hypothetical protein